MLLTFVIPIYNVEKYIEECLDSIYSQDLVKETFEVICVDDCGQDNSIKIIEEYISSNKIDNCSIVHHAYNKGLSGARNTGANIAKGHYIMFVDSDDFLFPNSIKEIWKYLDLGEYDLIEVNCHERVESKNVVYLSSIRTITDFASENGEEYLVRKTDMKEYYPMAVTKIVRKDTFLKCGGFKEGIYFEDEEYTPRLYLSATKCITLNIPVYLYRRRDGSITTTVFEKERWIESYFYVIKSMLNLCERHINKDCKECIYQRACEMIISLIKNCAYYNVDKKIFVKAVSLIKEKKLYKYPQRSSSFMIRFQGYFMLFPKVFCYACKMFYLLRRKDCERTVDK